MYVVQLDENMFFTGTYAKIGSILNGVQVEELPPSENSLCYKLVDKEVTETKEIPVLQYIMYTTSETETVTTYTIPSVDELGLETRITITEEEYNALSEEEKADVEIIEVPLTITTELTKEEYDALEDKSNTVVSYKTDEEGNIVYETIEVTNIVKVWEFSQERYDELEAERVAAEESAKAEAEYQQSISNESLANRIAELEQNGGGSDSSIIEAMSEAILEGVNEV